MPLGVLQSGAHALTELPPLKLGKGCQELRHEATLCRRHVDVVLNAAEGDPCRIQLGDRIQHIQGGPAPPVELPDHHGVVSASFGLLDEPLAGRAVGASAVVSLHLFLGSGMTSRTVSTSRTAQGEGGGRSKLCRASRAHGVSPIIIKTN